MKLSPKAIEYCHDSSQFNVMKLWALKDEELIFERVKAIARMNPYLAFLCAEGSGDMIGELESDIIEYIDKKLDSDITSKRQFSSFLLVKLKAGLYEDCWTLMYKYGPKLIDSMSVSEIIYGLMDLESDRAALVVFYTGLQKCKEGLEKLFLEMMEDKDLFFTRTEANKRFFDTSVGYTVQRRDFRSLRLYFGNRHVLKTLFDFRADCQGWAQLPYLCEEEFFALALREKSKAELFLASEYITDILKIENRLDSRVIPDNSRAADEDVAYVEELLHSMESVLPRT